MHPLDGGPYYPVPYHANLEVFKIELEHLCQLSVLQCCSASAWGTPTFIDPKKDERVCWFSDLCEYNKLIKCKIYPLPRIMDIFCQQNGYKSLIYPYNTTALSTLQCQRSMLFRLSSAFLWRHVCKKLITYSHKTLTMS